MTAMKDARNVGDFDPDYESQMLADGYAGFYSSDPSLKETGAEKSNPTPKRRLSDIQPSVSKKTCALLNTDPEPRKTDINLEISKRKVIDIGGKISCHVLRP